MSHVRLFCDPMGYSPLGFSVHGISQARILEWGAISFSRGSSQSRVRISCLEGNSLLLSHLRKSKDPDWRIFLMVANRLVPNRKRSTSRLYIVTLFIWLICRVHHEKRWAGRSLCWCWERLGQEEKGTTEEEMVGSLTQWTWVWVNSRSWWWTGRPGVLWFMGSQRVGHDWVTQLDWGPQVSYNWPSALENGLQAAWSLLFLLLPMLLVMHFQNGATGNPLAIHPWSGLCASTAEGAGFRPSPKN